MLIESVLKAPGRGRQGLAVCSWDSESGRQSRGRERVSERERERTQGGPALCALPLALMLYVPKKKGFFTQDETILRTAKMRK